MTSNSCLPAISSILGIKGKQEITKAHFNGLHLAANYGLTSLAKLLVTRTAVDVNLPDSNEKTPLYIALSYNYDLLAEYLISLPGLDIHAGRKTRAGSILHAAAGFGNVRIAKVLIEKGADIEILKNRGLTPLHVAAENGCIDMIRFLLQAGSDAHKTSNSGATPLYRAARSGSIGSVEILLAAGSDVNALTWDGWTPIYEAIQSAHIGVLIVLLAAGANLQMTNLYGFSPFTFAQYYGRHEMVAIMSKAQEQRALRESFES